MLNTDVARYNIFINDIKKRLVSDLDTNTLQKKDYSKNIFLYCQLSLWRSYKLYQIILLSLEKDYFDGLLLSIRAQLEIIGGIGNILFQFKKLSNSEISINDFSDSIELLLLGTRNELIKSEYKSRNVKTLIQNTDKLCLFGEENKTLLMNLYDKYSEFCHPNSYSLLASIESVSNGKYLLGNNKFKKKEMILVDDILLIYPLLLTVFDSVIEI